MELAEAHRLALAMLARRIETVGERWMESGGVVALVGPTGVGKTTLIAKLAARWVLRHGARDIALVSTDCVRIGAQEQIHTLGRLLGVPAYAIDGAADLAELLDQLGERRLVLIDSAGLSQRDPRLARRARRRSRTRVDRLETSSGALRRLAGRRDRRSAGTFRRRAARRRACVTKLDEATSLGGTLSALIRAKLPLAYLSDGQQVPEDLQSGALASADRARRRAFEEGRRARGRRSAAATIRRSGARPGMTVEG